MPEFFIGWSDLIYSITAKERARGKGVIGKRKAGQTRQSQ